MRLFVIEWANTVPELVSVINEIKKEGHDILYWSGYNQNNISREDFPNTVFHDYFDALANRPAVGIDDTKFPPPGEDLLRRLADVESTVLTMMNKKYQHLSLDERKHLYYHLVKYWHEILKTMRPDGVIFNTIPHTVYDYVIYSLAKLLEIKTIMYDAGLTGRLRMILMNDYKIGNTDLQNAMTENSTNYSLADLSPSVREYYEKQVNPSIEATPIYTKEYLFSRSGSRLFKLRCGIVWNSIKDFSLFKKLFIFAKTEWGPNLRKEYKAVQTQPDFNKNFVYVPLNYQPECTTAPMGGRFVDQILMIETVSVTLPSGWLIYVKEHPGQWLPMSKRYFNYRYQGYYREIAKLPNVRVVPFHISNYDLINQCRAVATVTGTPGWEGLLRDKPALIFGYPWYQHCPGIFKIKDTESCLLALEKIKDGFTVEKQSIINFLYHWDTFSWIGYNDHGTKKLAKITEEEVTGRYVKSLLSELEDV